MNLLVIGRFYTEGFALHIAETLDDMGHTVRRFDPGVKPTRVGGRIGHRIEQVRAVVRSATDSLPHFRARGLRQLWNIAAENTVDLILVCHDFLWPAEVAELKRQTGAIIVMWFPDALVNIGKGFFMSAPYDAVFFKDPYIVQALKDVLRSAVYYLPECFNPKRHFLPADDNIPKEYCCDVTTAGNSHAWRVAFYSHLNDYDTKLWGPAPPLWMRTGSVAAMHQGRPVLNEDKARAFLGAKVVVNNLHYGEIWGVNVRTFEAAGIGAFQMVNWRPGLKQLFEDGKELISFKTMGDLREKLDYWLGRANERSQIAEAGKRRAYAEHTYELRLSLLLDSAGGRKKGYPMPQIEMLS